MTQAVLGDGPVEEEPESRILQPREGDPEELPTGIANLTYEDLLTLLWGSDGGEITGYQNRERKKDIFDAIGIDPKDYKGRAEEFLLDFEHRYTVIVANVVLMMYRSEAGDLSGEGEYITIPAEHRGDPRYQAKMGDKFDALSEWIEEEYDGPVKHVTASPRRGPGESTVEMLVRMDGFLNSLMAALDQRMGRRPEYAWAIEMGPEGGIPHYHILIFDSGIPTDWMTEWWISNGYGGDAGLDVETVPRSDSKQVVGYLVQYLNKESQSDYWLPILRLSAKRSFGFSQNLRKKIEPFLVRHEQVKEGEEEEEAVYTALWICKRSDWERIKGEFGDTLPPPAVLYDKASDIEGLSLLVHPARLLRSGRQ